MSADLFTNKVVLAPMMMGSNRTFRRLAHRFGAHILGGEMAHSHKVRKGDRREIALVSARHEEGLFSAQLCGCRIETLCEAAREIADRGAKIIDLNAGCPMHFVTNQGSGSALLESRTKLARIVEALKKAVTLPITVKIRSGFYTDKPRAVAVAQALEAAGVDAIAVHGRSREDFYSVPANWHIIRDVVQAVKVPVIGNGDVRTYEDALRMRAETGCHAVMIARSALQRPWIFKEVVEGKPYHPSPTQRWTLIEEHTEMLKECFGQRMAFEYFRWHAGWYVRWHENQKEIRTRWETLDLNDTENSWNQVFAELKDLTINGPDILPPPNLTYGKVEAG